VSQVFLAAALAELVLTVLPLWRLASGPTIGDRIVAVNLVATQSMLAVFLFAAAAGRDIYLGVALWLASFSYLGTMLWARYLERGLL
jgi:multicomponent Na+:H+ antiporter subunit F